MGEQVTASDQRSPQEASSKATLSTTTYSRLAAYAALHSLHQPRHAV